MSARRDRITDEAALWHARAQEPGFSRTDREEFASWLAGSSEHVLEYLSVAAISWDIRDALKDVDIDALLALARESDNERNVVAMPHPAAPAGASPRKAHGYALRKAVWPAAATALVAVAAGIWLVLASGPEAYSTGVGEQISIALDDGSVVTLNTQTSLEVGYTETERTVRLTSGEALFNVAEEAHRPFQVVTEQAVVRAVGTSFNVRQRGRQTTVTVVEGTVDLQLLDVAPPDNRVGPASGGEQDPVGARADANEAGAASSQSDRVRLTAGQQARVANQVADIVVTEAKIENATSWRVRRLVFEAWPLADVVKEFNLYSDLRLEIGDGDLGSTLISGAFDADDPESFSLFLSAAGIAAAERRADGVVVLRLPDAVR